jgi:hypothetical protein
MKHRSPCLSFCLRIPLALLLTLPAHAQLKAIPAAPKAEPTTPAARSFHDPRSGVTFQVPAAWGITRKDGEVSTFTLDARSAKPTGMRAVANITFNPFPESTFSGAYFYLSYTPHTAAADCTHQTATLKSNHPTTTTQVGGVPFSHGYDEHGGVCTESRDEIYTAARNGACYRFDLVINNFCGGDVSGVKDMTPQELDSVRHRLESILSTVQFDSK